MSYYTINEEAARRANDMNSFRDYKAGSATAEYRRMVDAATELAERQKQRVDPMYHEKIDWLLEIYCCKLAENMNASYSIEARCPSILISGGGNFPVRKKEKQNAARDRNLEQWNYIQGLLDKIRGVGTGGISSDDPQAVEKLEARLAALEKNQEMMKAANAGIGYPAYELQNNNANIRRIRGRIAELKKRTESTPEGWEFDGGRVVVNTTENRLQVIFDGKPDADVRTELKGEGFRWAPSQGAWQRQLTDNAMRAARRLKCIAPQV